MRWSLFCRVIDNHGDAGFCLRLARELQARGERVQLFIDDHRALRWMQPDDAVPALPWPADARLVTDGKGKKIADVTTAEAVLKMAGLQPASVARESSKMSVVKQDIDLQRKVESDIADRWARGIVDGRPEEIRAAMLEMQQWNRDNPELRIRIGMDQIRRRVKEMRMPREQRFVKAAPKEIRNEVREALRQ